MDVCLRLESRLPLRSPSLVVTHCLLQPINPRATRRYFDSVFMAIGLYFGGVEDGDATLRGVNIQTFDMPHFATDVSSSVYEDKKVRFLDPSVTARMC